MSGLSFWSFVMSKVINFKQRTPGEIQSKLRELKSQKGFIFADVAINDLVRFLPYNLALEVFGDGEIVEEYQSTEYTMENVISAMRDYLDFAFEKAEGERGISANRSLIHYKSWLWLLGDDELYREFESITYESYGIPHLDFIKELIS